VTAPDPPEPSAEILALKRELNAVIRRNPDVPYTDEAVLKLLSVAQRFDGHCLNLGHWEKSIASSAIVSLGNGLLAPPTGALSPVQEQTLLALIEYAASPNPHIAGSAAHSLGMLKRREGIPALRRIIQCDDYVEDPGQPTTVWGVAFRALMRIDRDAAREFVGTRASREYLRGVENWLRSMRERNSAEEYIRELEDECAWLK
jgi:hypothetical protein